MSSETPLRLATLPRQEAVRRARGGALVLLPIGSLEQHGEHLPIGTDSLLVEEVCLAAAARAERDVLVAPTIWTGFSPHHVRFGATVSLGSATFAAVVREAWAGLSAWAPSVLVVNGHGGNRGPLITLAVETGMRFVSYFELAEASSRRLFPVDGGSPGHAGELETSLSLAVHAQLVGDRHGPFEPIAAAQHALLVPDMGRSGVLGDPSAATAEAGAAFLEDVTVALARIADELD
jgi:creatinine amidohydrolase/Fe(II)-dependent formamide hydrolase-like protein